MMNHRTQNRLKSELGEKALKQRTQSADKKNLSKLMPVPRKSIMKRKVVSRKKSEFDSEKISDVGSKQRGVKTYHISSTPLNTPSKVEKLKSLQNHDMDAVSDISKSSSKSSVCSSVSSGLIELLCNYNSTNRISASKAKISIQDGGLSDQDETLKTGTKYSFVIPTDQPNCDGRLKLLSGLLEKLKVTSKSIVSSGDTKNMKRLEKLIETMEKEFSGLQAELPAIWSSNRNFLAELESATAPLKEENAALQRKLRILNQTQVAKEQKSNEKDINLELETVQCMNNTLMDQIKKLSSLLQQLQDEKNKQEDVIVNLKRDNKKLNEDLLYKNAEFTKSREIFSTEAGTIKIEVANALQKVNALKTQLREAETGGELMKVSIQEKDDEISRLNDLNKGLQSSVSRLLEDLHRASTRPQSKTRSAPSNDVSSAFLKNLQNVLNTPQNTKNVQGDASFLQKSMSYHQQSYPLTKSFPPRHYNKENFISPHQDYIKGSCATDEFLQSNNFEVLESSRLSSMPTTSAGTSPKSSNFQHFRTPDMISDSLLSKSSKPTLWEQNSVASSFISFTTRDENDFANGLAILDADIQRLQESLLDTSSKTH